MPSMYQYLPHRSKLKPVKPTNSSPTLTVNHKSILKSHRRKKHGARSHAASLHKAHQRRSICLEGCRYDVVRRMALEMNFEEVNEHDVWNIIWTDTPISLDKALEMRRFQDAHSIFWGSQSPLQKANHFPGMNEICRKDRLARNLNRMKRCFPAEYSFFPKTWSLPADISDLLLYARVRKNATYICKPDSGCQGRGIFLIRNLKKLNPFAKLICQVYIPKPLLIDGYKFDLRIYILITSCDPLRIYIYNEGIARFATVKYAPPSDQNVDIVFMHLTNYSLNKFSQSYVSDGEGSKRKLSTVYDYLFTRGRNVQKMIEDIDDLVTKTMIAAQPTLRHYYRASFPKHDRGCACFEILGFDILIDEDMKPWLLEVNHSPSFNLDLPVDAVIKENLLRDTFNKIYLGSVHEKSANQEQQRGGPSFSNMSHATDKAGNPLSRALQIQFHHESLHQGNYRNIYPGDDCKKFAELFHPIPEIPHKAKVEGKGGERDWPAQGEDYVVTRTINKNGTVCTSKKNKNVSFLKTKFEPEEGESSELRKAGPPTQAVHGVPTNPSPEPPPQPIRRVPRRNFAKEALEIAQEHLASKWPLDPNQHSVKVEVERKPEPSHSLNAHQKRMLDRESPSFVERGRMPRLRLPLPAKVSSSQVVKPESNFRIFVNQHNQVSVYKFPAIGQEPSLAPSAKDHNAGDTDSLGKYLQKKQRKRTAKPSQDSLGLTAGNLARNSAHSLYYKPLDKNTLIEEWIRDGARARANGMTRSQYANNLGGPPEFPRKEIAPKFGSGFHIDEAPPRKPAEYFVPPKAHRRLPMPPALYRSALELEESERKKLLKSRERVIKRLGVEAQAFQVVRRSGKMKVEEEYLYSKIFPEEDYYSYLSPTAQSNKGKSHRSGRKKRKSAGSSPKQGIKYGSLPLRN